MPVDKRLSRMGKSLSSTLVFFLLWASFLFLSANPAPAEPATAGFEPPTLYVMNSPQAKDRIAKGFFKPVFRGFGSRTAVEIAKNELLGFHFLFDTECLCTPMLALVKQHQAQGKTAEQALRKAKEEHLEVLKKEFDRMDSLAKLYENYPGKDIGEELSFLFTTPHLAIAACYGPVVLVIEECRPRGLDLNGIARDAKYYSFKRVLENVARLRWKSIAADYVLDRDEYVIPSFIPSEDINGMIIYEPSKVVINQRLPLVPPKVRRVYRKHQEQGATVIDVFDGQDRLIERLSATPWSTPVDPNLKRSPEKLPPAVAEAWKNHVTKRRRPAARP
jgi:hypothetical protein